MVDFAELNRQRELYKQFAATDIGKLFIAFKSATIAYWQKDQDERISDKRLRELADKEREAEKAFRERLMADLGII